MNHAHPTLRRAAYGFLGATALTLVGLLLCLPPAAGEDAPRAETSVPRATGSLTAATEVPVRQVVDHAPGYYGAAVGTVLGYDLHGHYDYVLTHPEGGRQPSGLRVDGGLEVAVAARGEDALVVRVAFRGLALSALAGGTGRDTGGFGRAAQRPFDVRLGFDGKVRGYRFARELDAEQRNFLRGLFSSYVHTVPADAQGTWEADDHDAAGLLVARFTLTAAGDETRVERRKLRYTRLAGPELHPHRLTGASLANFDRGLGWLGDVQVDEHTHMEMAALGLSLELHTVLSFALTESRVEAPAGAVDADTETGWDAPAGCDEDLSSSVDAHERARWSQILAGRTLASLVDDLKASLAADPRDPAAVDRAWQAVIWQLRLDGAAPGQLREAVGAGMETELADLLISALGAAGSDSAQAALADMRHDADLSAAVRTSATIAAFQVARPTVRLLGDVIGDLGGATTLAGDDAMAMLLLGALAPRAEGVDVRGATAMDALVGFEAKAERQGRLDLWLNALGNAGGERVLPCAERLTTHVDETVRAAAYNALRKVDTSAAVAVLVRGLADPSSQVRADAVGALGEHRSPAACAALVRTARDDADPAVRRACLPGLSGFAEPGSQARRALEAMASSDPDEANRRAARSHLEGMGQGTGR
ncbi:MAG: HEAT repeat domain-containing protein [Planctomycetota bacterium]